MIQINPLRLYYAKELKQFKSQVMGAGTIYWGIQFSYPQLFKNPKSGAVESTLTLDTPFPNTQLFKSIQKWLRRCSKATVFIDNSTIIQTPYRITDSCLSWITHHPELKEHHLKVQGALHD